MSFLEKNSNEIKSHYNKQTVQEILIQGALKTTFQRLFDKSLFDAFSNADNVLKDFLFVTIRKPDLQEVNDAIQ